MVVQGNDVEFSCQATGDPAPSVTWLTATSVNVELLNNDRIEVRRRWRIMRKKWGSVVGKYVDSKFNIYAISSASSLYLHKQF